MSHGPKKDAVVCRGRLRLAFWPRYLSLLMCALLSLGRAASVMPSVGVPISPSHAGKVPARLAMNPASYSACSALHRLVVHPGARHVPCDRRWSPSACAYVRIEIYGREVATSGLRVGIHLGALRDVGPTGPTICSAIVYQARSGLTRPTPLGPEWVSTLRPFGGRSMSWERLEGVGVLGQAAMRSWMVVLPRALP